MARARFVRPEFFTDSKTGRMSPHARLLYIASWCQADIQGVLEWNADQLRLAAFPYDQFTTEQTEQLMAEIVTLGRVRIFTVAGNIYAEICKWREHQKFTTGEKHNGPRFPAYVKPMSDQCQTIVRPMSDQCQTHAHTLSHTHTPSLATQSDPPPDGLFDGANPPRKPLGARNFADWRIAVGKRIFWQREESNEWLALFDAEGWDELTRGYLHLCAKKPEPQKIFLSDIQGIR